MPTYLVTGCAEFIGSWITQTLLERGAPVRGLDNFETGKRENLAQLRGGSLAALFEFVECDLRDPEAAVRACQGIDVIFHEAALPSVPRSVKEESGLLCNRVHLYPSTRFC